MKQRDGFENDEDDTMDNQQPNSSLERVEKNVTTTREVRSKVGKL